MKSEFILYESLLQVLVVITVLSTPAPDNRVYEFLNRDDGESFQMTMAIQFELVRRSSFILNSCNSSIHLWN